MHEKNGITEVEKVLKTATVSKLYISQYMKNVKGIDITMVV